MTRAAIRFGIGAIALLTGFVVTGLGLLHVVAVDQYWVAVFGVTTLLGLGVLAWGGRTVLEVLPIPRVSITVER